MSTDSGFDVFIAEAQEQLLEMEDGLLRLSEGDPDSETLNALFRAAHTIKGSAGMFDLAGIVAFTHTVENALDQMRDGKIACDADNINLLLRSKDHIATLIDLAASTEPASATVLAVGEQCIREIHQLLAQSDPEQLAAFQKKLSEKNKDSQTASGTWQVLLRFDPAVLRDGMDPIAIFEYLATLGTIERCELLTDRLPKDNFDPELLYLGYDLRINGSLTRAQIREAFMFVEDGLEITITEPAIEPQPSLPLNEGDNQVGKDVSAQAAAPSSGPASTRAQKPQAESTALKAPAKNKPDKQSAAPKKYVRVESERLDQLINLIGELVVHKQRVDIISDGLRNTRLSEAVHSVGSITEQVRDAALKLRMTPIGDTFSRFKRIVRDTAKDLGKNIELTLIGEETELDRTMVERLTDPLTHIVRNAIDHGIEATAARIAAGKPPEGHLKLAAYHDSGSVVIEVSDDGGGLNLERITEKAIEKGILNEDHALSSREIAMLIFHPGFSTAASVTNLSGRGVGMDVVKRNIEELQGTVDIDSSPGDGTTIRIRIPLTLAIIDGFHTGTSGINFIIPQNTIVECIEFKRSAEVVGSDTINLRGELVPYISMRHLYQLPEAECGHYNIVIVQFGDRKAGLLVDELFGELQTVVKPLSPLFQSIKGVGGS
ncbi:MAG TPA: chemotaxis protein CheA, partial [Marinagarivorans sp.]